MDADSTQALVVVQGPIKWFDPIKGFGFLADSAGGADVLIHANVLRNFGQSSVAEAAMVVVRAMSTARGRQATEVLSIQPPPSDGQAPIADLAMLPPHQLDQLPLLPARVKWFDKAKGFGFANVFGQRGDVFLHIEVLRHWGFADLVPGEAVGLRIVPGPRGAIAAQILAWDRAIAILEPGGNGSAPATGSNGSNGKASCDHGPGFAPGRLFGPGFAASLSASVSPSLVATLAAAG